MPYCTCYRLHYLIATTKLIWVRKMGGTRIKRYTSLLTDSRTIPLPVYIDSWFPATSHWWRVKITTITLCPYYRTVHTLNIDTPTRRFHWPAQREHIKGHMHSVAKIRTAITFGCLKANSERLYGKLMFLSSADSVDVSGAAYTCKIGVYPVLTASRVAANIRKCSSFAGELQGARKLCLSSQRWVACVDISVVLVNHNYN